MLKQNITPKDSRGRRSDDKEEEERTSIPLSGFPHTVLGSVAPLPHLRREAAVLQRQSSRMAGAKPRAVSYLEWSATRMGIPAGTARPLLGSACLPSLK